MHSWLDYLLWISSDPSSCVPATYLRRHGSFATESIWNRTLCFRQEIGLCVLLLGLPAKISAILYPGTLGNMQLSRSPGAGGGSGADPPHPPPPRKPSSVHSRSSRCTQDSRHRPSEKRKDIHTPQRRREKAGSD